MIVRTKESKAMGKADLVFYLSCRAIGHVEESKVFALRLAGTPFHDV
jgi:hypothetical protein